MRQIVKKIVFIGLGLSLSVLANAVPNVWTSGLQMGIYGFVITNHHNQELHLSCNVARDETVGHGVFYNADINLPSVDLSISTGVNAENDDLSFLIDDNVPLTEYDLMMDTARFFKKMISAKKIQVYHNNQELGVFTPSANSRTSQSRIMQKECINGLG